MKNTSQIKRTFLSGKIHRAVVTQADLNYVGSITIDKTLMDAANIVPYEQVHVVNISDDSADRIVTYAIPGSPDSGIICLNGAAAHHFSANDKVIIMSYAEVPNSDISEFQPKVVFVDDLNKITQVMDYEKHGPIENTIKETK